jgi:hypothetical protein
MREKRKAFQDLPGNENPQFLEDGKRIYYEIRKKYPNNTTEDLDNILNGLTCALHCLMKCHVDKENHKNFLHLIWNILNKNIE